MNKKDGLEKVKHMDTYNRWEYNSIKYSSGDSHIGWF